MKSAISPERSRTLARLWALTLIVLSAAVLLVTCGWAVSAGHAKWLFIALAGAGMCALAFAQRGLLIGLLLLAALDGLPFFDTSRLVTSKLAIEDIAIISLIGFGVLWLLLDGRTRPHTRAGRIIARAGVPLLLWCLFVMAISVTSQRVPILRGLYFARDFILFAAILVVLPRVQLTRRDLHATLAILASGVCVFAIGQIMIATGSGAPGSLIHFHYTLAEAGFTGLQRVYANMTDLVTAGLATSTAAVLLARKRSVRLIALPIMALLTVSTVVQLTRARWLGIVIGLVLVSLWLIFNSNVDPRVGAILRKRLGLVFGILGIALVIVIAAVPSINSGGTVINRFTSIFTDIQSGGGTLAIRETVSSNLKMILGERWPFGLGFVPPYTHYYFGLPGGSIRNPDVGVLNAVMTMGVFGAILIYFPAIVVLFDCLRRVARQRSAELSWLYYGGAIWLVATLVSSITLITLFSTSGLAMTAVFLTVLTSLGPEEELASRTSSVAAINQPPGWPLSPIRSG